MTYLELKKMIDGHNWDDGFAVPEKVLKDPNCDLALALEIFYLGDGYRYLIRSKSIENENEQWLLFISDLYIRIKEGLFKRRDNHFTIPLNTTQIYKLRKAGVSEVFLEY